MPPPADAGTPSRGNLTRLLPKGASGFFVAFTAMNVSNFAFHMVTSRVLDAPSYGALGALLSIMLVLQVPVAGLQVAITQQVSAHVSSPEASADPLTRLSLLVLVRKMFHVALVAAAALGILAFPLRSYLHLDDTVPLWLLAVDVFPLLLGLVPRAVLLGLQRFATVGLALVIGAFVRLALGYIFGQLEYGVTGAMTATVIGDSVMAVILLTSIHRSSTGEKTKVVLQVHARDAIAAGVAFTGFLVLVGTDTVLARHYLSPASSAAYVAAATAARSALFLSSAIGFIYFPVFARHNGEGPDARHALVRSLSISAVLGSVATAGIALFPGLFVTVLFGDGYRAAEHIVGLLAFGSAVLGLLWLLVYFHLARRSPRAWFPWVGVVCTACAIAYEHSGRWGIVRSAVLVSTVLAVILIIGALRSTRGESLTALASLHRPKVDERPAEIDLSVVVPFYNPGPRFVPSLRDLVSTLSAEDISFEVIAVSDGSTDDSAEAIQPLLSEHGGVIRFVTLERNWGKGEALRVGLSMGRGRYLGFIDADGDINAAIFHSYLALVKLYEPDIVLGSKRHPMSEVHYPIVRRIYSWGYQQLIYVLFHLDVRDTQTGIKLVRREVVAAVLPRMIERGFAFDLELFVVARHLGFHKVFEAPVRIGMRFTSSVSRRAALAMFRDTFSVFYRLRVLHQYDKVASEANGGSLH